METVLIVSSILLWLVVLLNVLVTLALVRRVNATSTPRESLKAGEQAPAFAAKMLDGETIALTSYTSTRKQTVFLFISTHCAPCRDLLAALRELVPTAHQTGTNLVLVSSDGLEETVSLVEEMKLTLPVLLAPRQDNPFFNDYKVFGTPSYCHINEQGMILSSGYFSLQFGEWKALIETWIAPETSALSERR